jgi:phosphate transport system permease protein
VEAAQLPAAAAGSLKRRRLRDRVGDLALIGITLAASVLAVVVLVAVAWRVLQGTHLAWSTYGLSFITSDVWDPVKDQYGALSLIFGTAVTAAIALVIATPLAIGIGLYLSELAPKGVGGVIATMVELLASVPSVVLGLWGIFVLGPLMGQHVEPWLHEYLGFLPIFSGTPTPSGVGILTAGLILAIMILPIVASISRELFSAVPNELEEGALALGTTRWEMVRGVILPAARSGVAAAVILGLGRALGEAIAVIQVIGNQPGPQGIHRSLFEPGSTLAGQIANSFAGSTTPLQTSSLFYCATILLVIGLGANLAARWVVRRFDPLRAAD